MASSASQLPTPDQVSGNGQSASPHFILIERNQRTSHHQAPLVQAWKRAISTYFANEKDPPFTLLEGGLLELDPTLLECDCLVSPANSYGIMDGGYDDVLSRAFRGDTRNYWTLTNHVQAYIKRESRGYLPPGSCIIVPLPPDLAGPNNPWKARFIAVLPTMRAPAIVSWHQDIVYNCMWSLQTAIENYNRHCMEEEDMIHSVLLTGLATGCGHVGARKCARQMILAVQHFRQPTLEQPRWMHLEFRENQIEETIALSD